jgi:hypothetical protein
MERSMAQVTIYLPSSTLEVVKSVAAKEELSVSQWFAQFAHAQEKKATKSWTHFLDDLDDIYGKDKPGGLDILLGEGRYADLAPVRSLESL